MPKGQKLGGRVKGTPNKVTASAKDCIVMTAKALGGEKRLAAWVKEDPANERAFWVNIYPKLLPYQVTGEDAPSLTVIINKP